MQGRVIRSFQTNCLFLCIMLWVWPVTHESANSGFGKNEPNESEVDCEQKLMEEIFMCVSGNGIDLSKFLLAMGGINNIENSNDESTNDSLQPGGTDIHSNSSAQPNMGSINEESENRSDSNLNRNSSSISHGISLDPNTNKTSSELDNPGVNSSAESITKQKGGNKDTEGDHMDFLDEELKSKVCGVQQGVMECTFQAAKSLLGGSTCATAPPPSDVVKEDSLDNPWDLPGPSDQRSRVRSTVEALLGQYDVFCAPRCRITLLDDMRSCYEQFDLDPELFLSSKSHGAVIGSSAYDVEVFCGNKEGLLQCLRNHSENCPESDLVLSAIGLDMELMGRGFEILCQHQYTYLHSLECFESHTPEVGICHSIKHRRMVDTASRAALQNWTTQRYLQHICGVRLDHIECDLKAWSQKQDKSCDEHSLALKKKLHCSLIPPQCLDIYKKTPDFLCEELFRASVAGCSNIRNTLLSYSWILCFFSIIYQLLCQG